MAAPAVEAALQTVKIKDSGGGAIDAKSIPAMGLFDAPGSNGALAVRNFAGGGGFLAAIDCAAGAPQNNTVTLPSGQGVIITGIIMTGNGAGANGVLGVQSAAIGPINLMHLRVTPDHPNDFVGLGNGLTLTDDLTLTCDNGAGGAGQGQVIVLGQGNL
jgi:hypothetical protein